MIIDYHATIDLLTAVFRQARREAQRGDTEAKEFLTDMGATGAKEQKKMGKLTLARAALASDTAKVRQFEQAIAAANRKITDCEMILASPLSTVEAKVQAQTDMDNAGRTADEMNRQLQAQRRLTAVTAERVRDLEQHRITLQQQLEACEKAAARWPEGASTMVSKAQADLQVLANAMMGTQEGLRLRDMVIALGALAGQVNQPQAELQRAKGALTELE